MIVSLEDKLRPEHTAIIVVDVQHDFCSHGGYMHQEGHPLDMVEAMLPKMEMLLGEARRIGVPRIFLQAQYATSSNWYLSQVWLDRARRANPRGGHIKYPVCQEGAWGFDLVESVRAYSEDENAIVLKKHRYSGFVNTELDLILRSRGIQTVVVTGVATNVCVESTARDAFMRDYFVILPSDCCAAYSENEQQATLANIRQYFGQVATAEEVIAAWQGMEDDLGEGGLGDTKTLATRS